MAERNVPPEVEVSRARSIVVHFNVILADKYEAAVRNFGKTSKQARFIANRSAIAREDLDKVLDFDKEAIGRAYRIYAPIVKSFFERKTLSGGPS